MDSNFYGVIIGGLIGVIPSLVIVFVEAFKEHRRQAFELRMEQMRIYEVSRKDAIEKFMYYLGAMASDSLSPEMRPEKFFAAAHMVKIYVSDKTAKAINDVESIVAKSWGISGEFRDNYNGPKLLDDKTFTTIDRLLYEEIQTPPINANMIHAAQIEKQS